MSLDDDAEDRRTVLKSITAGALGATVFSGFAGSASADADAPTPKAPEDLIEPDEVVRSLDDVETSGDCTTETEYRCASSCPKDGSYEKLEKRECLKCGGDYISCEDWQYADRCCF